MESWLAPAHVVVMVDVPGRVRTFFSKPVRDKFLEFVLPLIRSLCQEPVEHCSNGIVLVHDCFAGVWLALGPRACGVEVGDPMGRACVECTHQESQLLVQPLLCRVLDLLPNLPVRVCHSTVLRVHVVPNVFVKCVRDEFFSEAAGGIVVAYCLTDKRNLGAFSVVLWASFTLTLRSMWGRGNAPDRVWAFRSFSRCQLVVDIGSLAPRTVPECP